MRRSLLILTLVAAAVVRVASAAGPATTEPTTRSTERQPRAPAVVRGDRRTFDLRPVPPADPGLRYSLSVYPADREPGDAAPLYLRAADLVPADAAAAFDPLAKPLPGVAADDLLARCRPTLELVDRAARLDRCAWAAEPAAGVVPTLPALPHLNRAKLLANLLDLRAGRQLAAGDVDGVVATVRDLFALAAHTAAGSNLVGGLVGIGIESQAVTRAAELMSLPAAPNLYWATAAIPRPVVDLRAAIAGERRWLRRAMPVTAKGRRPESVTADDWGEWAKEYRAMAVANGSSDGGPSSFALSMKMLPAATRWYAATHARATTGPTTGPTTVPAQLVLARYAIGRFQAVVDEQDEVLSLPYPELLPRWWRAFDAIDREPGNPLVDVLLWPLQPAPRPFARAERAVAALTAVEAVRAYAAAHGGRLPDRLDDVTEVPVPANPITGKPFEYRVENGAGVLADHDPVAGDYPLEYTVRVRTP